MTTWLVIWLAFPLLYRFYSRVSLRYWGRGLAQDIAVATQAAVILTFLHIVAGHSTAWAIASVIILFACQTYLLLDAMLYRRAGIRLSPSLLLMMRYAPTFESSAPPLQVIAAVGGLWACLMVIAIEFLWPQRLVAESFDLTFASVAGLMLIAGRIAIVSHRRMPANLAYGLNNGWFALQLSLVQDWRNRSRPLKDGAELVALRHLGFSAERYTQPRPDLPLFRYTTGFTGERLWSVRRSRNEKPHVIVLFLESFRARDVGILGGRHSVTPNFDRLAREGILWSRFYCNGNQTARGAVAALYGLLSPMDEVNIQGKNPPIHLRGMPHVFADHGYLPAFVHGGGWEYENTLRFFFKHGFREFIGQPQIRAATPDAPAMSWGVHDRYMFNHLLDWLSAKDAQQQPVFASVFTITNHHPWAVPPGFTGVSVNAPQRYARYLQTFAYTDQCLGGFVEALHARGLAEKTILWILADTGYSHGEHTGTYSLHNHMYEENVHIPLLLYAPGRLARPMIRNEVGSQVDLLPTMLDALDLSGMHHAMGRTLARDVPDRCAFLQNPFAPRYLGLRRGDHKFVHVVEANATECFDVIRDPDESNDLSRQLPGECAEAAQLTVTIQDWVDQVVLNNRLAP